MPSNDLGLERHPLSTLAFEITDRYWRWAEPDGRLWLTWRPAILLLPALGAILLFAIRPGARRFLLPSSLLAGHALNVALTSPAQEFRYALPLYLISAFTLALLVPALRRGEPVTEPDAASSLPAG
jgi:hypothetical protein